MANQISTGLNVRTWAVTINREAPILTKISRKLNGLLEPGQGNVINVLTPNYRPILRQESLQPLTQNNLQVANSLANLKVQIDPTPVTVLPRVTGASYGLLDATLMLSSKEDQIEDPQLSYFASNVNRSIFEKAIEGSGTAIIGKINSAALSLGSAALTNLRAEGEKWGMLNPNIQTTLATDPQFRWLSSSLAERNYRGVLGNFVNTDFFNSPDCGSIQLGSSAGATPAYAISGTVAPISDGAVSLNISNITFGGDTLTSIPGGVPFIIGTGDPAVEGSAISPFYVPNGFSQLRDKYVRVFISKYNLQNDANGIEYDAGWPISSGNATVGIATVHLAQIVNNVIQPSMFAVADAVYVGSSAQAASMPIFTPLLAGASYSLGNMATEQVVAFASATPAAPRANVITGQTAIEGIYNIRVTSDYENISRQSTLRLEGLDGCTPLYRQAGVALYHRN